METRILEQDGKIIVHSWDDCQSILEHNKVLREIEDAKHGQEMYHVARFKKVIIENYINLTGITFQEFMDDGAHIERLMRDPDLAGFRIRSGKY